MTVIEEPTPPVDQPEVIAPANPPPGFAPIAPVGAGAPGVESPPGTVLPRQGLYSDTRERDAAERALAGGAQFVEQLAGAEAPTLLAHLESFVATVEALLPDARAALDRLKG